MNYIDKFLKHFNRSQNIIAKYKHILPDEKLYAQINDADIKEIIETNPIAESELRTTEKRILIFIKERNLNRRCYIEDNPYFMYNALRHDFAIIGREVPNLKNINILVFDTKPSFGKTSASYSITSLEILPLEDEWFICRAYFGHTHSRKLGNPGWIFFKCDSIDGVFQLIVDYKI